MSVYNVGDRVFYSDNGPEDTGTVLRVSHGAGDLGLDLFEVEWDDTLGAAYMTDWFHANQLESVED